MAERHETNAGLRSEPLVISRRFPAARDLVFRAWSSAEHMKRWFSPESYTVPEAEIDCRPGGVFAICMRSADGQVSWCRGTYVEVVPSERLKFSAVVIVDGVPRFTAHTTVTFADDEAGTRMTVHQAYDIHDEAFITAVKGAPVGWRTTLDKLAQEVARMQNAHKRSVAHSAFSLERTYGAPPAAVFHAFSDKAAKARWFEGGESYQVLEREMDVRPGGRERLKGRWASGMVSVFEAVYYDVVPNQRLIYAYEMHLDGRKISVSLATIEFKPAAAGTQLLLTEQGAFLDGYEDGGSREHGTGLLLDRLGASL